MTAVLIVAAIWVALSPVAALLVGRAIRLADQADTTPASTVPDYVPDHWAA